MSGDLGFEQSVPLSSSMEEAGFELTGFLACGVRHVSSCEARCLGLSRFQTSKRSCEN